MNIEEQTPVDTSENSSDRRIGPDGKITAVQGDYLKAKAIENISESIVKRAQKLDGRPPEPTDRAYDSLFDRSVGNLTKLDDGTEIHTEQTPHGEDVLHVYSPNGDVRSTGKSDIHTFVANFENGEDQATLAVSSPDGYGRMRPDYRVHNPDVTLAQNAIDTFKEQRRVIEAAQRVNGQDEDPLDTAA